MLFEHDDAVRSVIRRASVVKVYDDQSQQRIDLYGLNSERPTKVFRPQDHGFSSNPPANSEGLLLALGGRSDRAVYLDGGHKDYRPRNTPQGAAVLYDDKGNVVFVKSADGIVIEAKSGKITVKPPQGQLVYLGGNGTDGVYGFVETDAGVSMNVKARVS